MKITILHLSDLHANLKEVAHVKKVMSGLFKDLDRLSLEDVKPDLVLFTGDLINKGENATEEFKLCSSEVIEPLLSKLGLTQDALFTIPGNHEINRKKSYKEIEVGLEQNLKNSDAVTEYYSTSSENSASFKAVQEKLAGYYEFVKAYKNDDLVAQTFFYNAYKIKHSDKLTIGIVGLNSAWRSSGFGSDNGRLIIGETIIDDALTHIKDCDLKICLCHHPFEMLCEWDAKIIRRRVAKAFDFLFTGHVHDSDVAYTKQIFGGVIVCTSGCLNKNHLNFYSIIQCDLAKKEVTVRLRKWYEDRGEFDQETDKAENGLITFTDFKCGNPETADLIEISEMRSKMHDSLRKAAIINPLEGVVELSLTDVFVEPIISDTSAFGADRDEANVFVLGELLASQDSLIFFGRPDYGKTSLLEHAYSFILEDDKQFEGKIPVFMKFSELPKNNPEGIKHFIRRQLDEYASKEQVEKYLSQGRMIILIDDFYDRQEPKESLI